MTQTEREPSWRESLAVTLTRAARVLSADLDAALKPKGLTSDQWLVLQTLSESNGLTMTEIADHTGTNSATLTRVVDRLVSDALTYREVDAGDRRKVRVYISKRGLTLHRKLATVVTECEQALLDRGDLAHEALLPA